VECSAALAGAMALLDGCPGEWGLEAASPQVLDQLQADAFRSATGGLGASGGVPRDVMEDAFRALPDVGAGI